MGIAWVPLLLIAQLLNYAHLGRRNQNNCFFSGRKGPVLNTGKGNRHKLPSKEFKLELENLGGCPKEVLQNHELMEIFEPILRADFKAVETYQYASTEPLHQKITLFHGIQDHFTKEDVMTWQQESTQPLEYFEFDGGHFFLYKKNVKQLVKQLKPNYTI
jgi:external thioesterase TEII